MKIRNIIVGILTLGILNVFSGCEDFLDKSPDMGLSEDDVYKDYPCLLYTSPSPRDSPPSRMPSSA